LRCVSISGAVRFCHRRAGLLSGQYFAEIGSCSAGNSEITV
jgi:hypothetical protein